MNKRTKMKKFIILSVALFFQMASSQILIHQGANWKYLDNGSNQGTAWRDLSFNDSSWSSGNAQLGYGDGDEVTVISYGSSSSNKYVCYYFRKAFNVTNAGANSGVKISLLRDDGAVVYINGQEVVRSNMPAGSITYTTLAAHTVSGSAEDAFYEYNVPSSVLQNGQNIIAVEVHQRSRSSSDVSFDLKLEFSDYNSFKKLPYVLYAGDNDKMLINWQLNSTQTSEFKYGTDTNYTSGTVQTTEYNGSHQHTMLITGLSPDQKYYYRISVNGASVHTGSFQTAPPDTAQQLVFFAYGDNRTHPADHDAVAEAIMNDINQNNLKQTIILNSGDLVSNGNSENSWQDKFFNQQYTHISDLLSNLPYVAAMGNHEGQGLLFSKYFNYPMYQSNRYYYSFDYGPAHFTVIDQFTNYSQASAQNNWIINDLSTSNKSWKIVVLHKPGWSAGGHGNDTDVQNILQPVFEQYGVSFVINGHNHYYSRAVVNGVQHITTGGGGAPLYTPDNSYPNIVETDQSHHYCKLSINGNSLHFSAIRDNNTIIEEFDAQVPASIGGNDALANKWETFVQNDKIYIDTKEKAGRIEIYNLIGKKLHSQDIYHHVEFDIPSSGIYFVRFIYHNKQSVKKIIATNKS